jgi:hypothetical protein
MSTKTRKDGMAKQRDVHPVADLFPMLADDELAELAADIKQRGQLQPIVLDTEGRIIDGRNRLAACEMAGVKPEFTTYEGDDPDGYALAVNIARRHLSTGARAMIAAKAARLNGRGHQRAAAESADLHISRITEASVVLDWAPDLADAVITGAKPLSVAVDTARAKKKEAELLADKMDRLRGSATDLLALVEEGRMDVDDATAALDAREEKARQEAATVAAQERALEAQRESERRVAASNLRSVLTYLTSVSIPPDRLATQEYGEVAHEFDQGDLDYAVQTMTAIAQTKRNSNG